MKINNIEVIVFASWSKQEEIVAEKMMDGSHYSNKVVTEERRA